MNAEQAGGQVRLGNEVYIDEDANRVGIGTTATNERLEVAGNAKVTGGKVTNNNNENMLPIAFGRFHSDGTKQAGTANISMVQVTPSNGAEYSVITVAGVNLINAVASVTIGFATATGWSSAVQPDPDDPTKLRVTNIVNGESKHMHFHIVIYKTN